MSKLGNFVWGIADQLRGPYKPHQYGAVILPFTILRRLDCVLASTRHEVWELAKKYSDGALNVQVKRATGLNFYNTSAFDFAKLLEDPEGLRANLVDSRAPSVRSTTRPPAPAACCRSLRSGCWSATRMRGSDSTARRSTTSPTPSASPT